jgi:hypothetical protein
VPIEQGIDNALYGLDLPYVVDRKVTFMNIDYEFSSDLHNGKQFATVLRHGDDRKYQLVSDANFIVMQVFTDFTNFTSRKTIAYDGVSYKAVAYDTNAPETELHSGSIGNENTFDTLYFKQIYDRNISILLPINMLNANLSGLTVTLNVSSKHTLDLPIKYKDTYN